MSYETGTPLGDHNIAQEPFGGQSETSETEVAWSPEEERRAKRKYVRHWLAADLAGWTAF